MTCLVSGVALAQVRQPHPFEMEMRAVQAAREQGLFSEAARHREMARRLLEESPADHTLFPDWVRSLTSLYAEAGRTEEARAVVLGALRRQPGRRELLLAAADAWEEDGLSLRAAAFRSQIEAEAGAPKLAGSARQADRAAMTSGPLDRLFHRAGEAVAAGRAEDAFGIGAQLLADAGGAPLDESIFSRIPLLASRLAPRQADRLWVWLFAVAQDRSGDTLVPLLRVSREYVRYLSGFPERAPAVRDALSRYRELVLRAHGPASAELASVLRLTMEFELDQGETDRAAAAAAELLSIEESLNGPESASNVGALQAIAGFYEIRGDGPRARALHLRAIHITDQTYARGDYRRAAVRMQAAFALGHLGEAEEAESLAKEAVALYPAFADELEQVLELAATRLL